MNNEFASRRDEETMQVWPVRPLTRTRRSDGSAYFREKATEAQVQELSALPERERSRRLLDSGGDWKDSKSPRAETLVYFLREYDRRGDSEMAWRLAALLPERVKKHIESEIARWRLSREDAEDCVRDLQVMLWKGIFDAGPSAEFWEVHFWTCLDRRLWNIVEKRQLVTDTEQSPGDQLVGTEEEALDILLRQPDRQIGPAGTTEIRAALAILNPSEQRAVHLIYELGLPEESDDPDRLSAAKVMGVTGRSVRNYLRRAREKIGAWQRENDSDR